MSNKLLLVILLCASTAASALDVYKWTDAGGVVHFSDTKPANVKVERVHVAGMIGSDAAVQPEDTDATATPDAQNAKAARDKTLVASVVNAQKRCDQARASLSVLRSEGPVGIDTHGSGKPQPLDDRERQRLIASAQSSIASYCK